MYLCEVIGCGQEGEFYESWEGGFAAHAYCEKHAIEKGLLMPDEGFYEDEPYTLDVQFLNEDFG